VSKLYKLPAPVIGEHDKGYTQPGGAKVPSRQDFTERCPAGGIAKSTSPSNCKIPHASAHDHHEGNLDVETRVFLVNDDGNVMNEEKDYAAEGIACVDFDKRSTYLFKYDAADASGNRADQLVFALILDDTTAPQIIGECGDETVNAATGTCANCDKTWTLCASDVVTDNVDSGLTDELLYTITRLNGDADPTDNCPVTAPCNRVKAKKAISTLYQAEYRVRTDVKDHANWYGVGFNSNPTFKERVISVIDKPAEQGGDDFNIPTITMHPATHAHTTASTDEVHECATQYTDNGAYANDKLDDALNAGGCKDTNTCVTVTHVNLVPDYDGDAGAPANAKYTVTYKAKDSHQNPALNQLRNVFVTDTTDPAISLVAASDGALDTINHYASATASAIGETNEAGTGSVSDPGVTCVDTCDKTSLPITTKWKGTAWNPQVVACYKRDYTCTDVSKNTDSIERTFCNVDADAPILTLNHEGANQGTVTREAANNAIYTDAGAKCYDYHHHLVSMVLDKTDLAVSATETYANHLDTSTTGEFITGDVVDMSVPNTYTITYKCRDAAGNTAIDASRTVIVKDTTHPTIERTGDATVFIEAGFKYTDAGATASDTLDGVITGKITKTVETVEGPNSFAGLVSSTEIAVPKVGKYVLSYHVEDKAGNDEAVTIKRTIVVKDTLPPVITLKVGSEALHTSDHSATGVNAVANPAGKSHTLGTSLGSNPNID